MFEISLDAGRKRLCNGVSRRDFLRVGALAPLGISLAQMLAIQSAVAADAAPALKTQNGAAIPKSKTPRAKSVILLFLGGGLSHHDTFDLKPDAPAEIRGKYKSIPSSVPGTHVGELLPKMAQMMDKVALVRSGAHNNDHHETATNWVLSGRFGSAFGDFPAIGAVVAHESGFEGRLPAYAAVPRNPSFTWELGRSAFLGGRCESFKVGDPNDKNFKVRDLARAQVPTPRALERRKSLTEAVDGLAGEIVGNDQLDTYGQFQRKAAEMILSPEAQAAFDIEKETPQMRDRYGRTTLGQSCLMARRLAQSGVRFITINSGGWDHHAKIWDGLERMAPDFDKAFSALISDMHEQGLLSQTLVVVMGEFGRTPKINKDVGRDHWGPAASLLFAGPGIAHGRVIGATDKLGAQVTERPVRPADVACTIYEALGIDPRKMIHTPDGRPIHILDEGESIQELYA